MNWFVMLIVLSIVLAVLKAAAIALMVTLLLALVFAFISHPRETLLFLGSSAVLGLATAQPLAFILVLGVVCLALVVSDAWRASRKQPLLIGDGEHH